MSCSTEAHPQSLLFRAFLRPYLRGFVRSVMTEQELRDGLLLAAATLVVLPILPNRTFGPYGLLNPYLMWSVVIMVMVIAAAGHVAVRVYGAQYGLALTGLAARRARLAAPGAWGQGAGIDGAEPAGR